MMKPNVSRRRTKLQIDEDKRNALIEKQELEQKLAGIEQMQAELMEMKLKYQKIEPLANCAHEMVQAGVLSQEVNGTYTLVEGYE